MPNRHRPGGGTYPHQPTGCCHAGNQHGNKEVVLTTPPNGQLEREGSRLQQWQEGLCFCPRKPTTFLQTPEGQFFHLADALSRFSNIVDAVEGKKYIIRPHADKSFCKRQGYFSLPSPAIILAVDRLCIVALMAQARAITAYHVAMGPELCFILWFFFNSSVLRIFFIWSPIWHLTSCSERLCVL